MSLAASLARLLPGGRFARSVLTLMGGTVGGQLLLVLAAPLLTRLYTPDDFGVLAVFAALLAILAVIASLRYQLAIPLPEDDGEAAHILVLCLLVVLGTSTACLIAVLFLGDAIAAALGVPAIAAWLWLLPLGLLLAGSYQAFNHWAIRKKGFGAIARTRLTQSLGAVTIQLAGHGLGPLALLLGQVTGQGAGLASLAATAWRQNRKDFTALRMARLREVASRHRSFPLFSTPAALFNIVGRQLPALLFAMLFGPAIAGLYILAQRVLAMPMALVGNAIANALFSDAAGAHREGRLGALVLRVQGVLARLAMLPALVLLICGPALFELAFGAAWRDSGEMARWMAPWIYFRFTGSPLSTLIFVIGRQRTEPFFQLTILGSSVAGLAIGHWLGSHVLAIALISGLTSACWLVFALWLMNTINGEFRNVLALHGRSLLASLPAALPLLAIVMLEPGAPAVILLALASAGLAVPCYLPVLRDLTRSKRQGRPKAAIAAEVTKP